MIAELLSNVNISLALSLLAALVSYPLIVVLRRLDRVQKEFEQPLYSFHEMRQITRKKLVFYPAMAMLSFMLMIYFVFPFAVFAKWAEFAFQHDSPPYDTNLAVKGMIMFACWFVVFSVIGYYIVTYSLKRISNKAMDSDDE